MHGVVLGRLARAEDGRKFAGVSPSRSSNDPGLSIYLLQSVSFMPVFFTTFAALGAVHARWPGLQRAGHHTRQVPDARLAQATLPKRW